MVIQLPFPMADGAVVVRDTEGRRIIDLSDQPMAVVLGITRLMKVRAEEEATGRARVEPLLMMPPEFRIELTVSESASEINGLRVREGLLRELVSHG